MSVKAYSPVVKEFHNYFRSLNPTVNKRNQWFEEYWQERFQCYLNEEYKKKFTRDCKSKKFKKVIIIKVNIYLKRQMSSRV